VWEQSSEGNIWT